MKDRVKSIFKNMFVLSLIGGVSVALLLIGVMIAVAPPPTAEDVAEIESAKSNEPHYVMQSAWGDIIRYTDHENNVACYLKADNISCVLIPEKEVVENSDGW